MDDLADLLSNIAHIPVMLSMVFGLYGLATAALVVVYFLFKRKIPSIDVFGLKVALIAMAVLALIPLFEQLSEERLDFNRHGFHTNRDLFTYLTVSLAMLLQFSWGAFRVYRAGLNNIFISTTTFGLLNLIAFYLAFQIGSWLQTPWST